MRINGAKLSRKWLKTAAGQVQLCIETQGRDILATIVNDAVTEAMSLAASGAAEDLHSRGSSRSQPRVGRQ